MTESMESQEDREARAMVIRTGKAMEGADIISYTIEDQGFTGEVYTKAKGKKTLVGRFTGGGDDTGKTKPAYDAFHQRFMRLVENDWLPMKTHIRGNKVCCSGHDSKGQWISVTIEVTDTRD